VAAGQLGLTGGAQPIFFLNTRKTTFGSPTAQEMCSLDNGVSSLFINIMTIFFIYYGLLFHGTKKRKFKMADLFNMAEIFIDYIG
jgi:hypothetical protein